MQTLLVEIRDRATCIPAVALRLNASVPGPVGALLRRSGYDRSIPYTVLMPCSGRIDTAYDNPHAWGGRTLPVAHAYIHEHFQTLKDGDVIDVEFILGESVTKKSPEWRDEGHI